MQKDFTALKKLRLEKKKTLKEVANYLHISDSYLSRIENNHRFNPALEIYIMLAQCYEITLDELISLILVKNEEIEIW